MDISSIMSSQLRDLQQTVQMSVLKSALNMEAVGAIEMLKEMPENAAPHPFKGSVVDIQV